MSGDGPIPFLHSLQSWLFGVCRVFNGLQDINLSLMISSRFLVLSYRVNMLANTPNESNFKVRHVVSIACSLRYAFAFRIQLSQPQVGMASTNI